MQEQLTSGSTWSCTTRRRRGRDTGELLCGTPQVSTTLVTLVTLRLRQPLAAVLSLLSPYLSRGDHPLGPVIPSSSVPGPLLFGAALCLLDAAEGGLARSRSTAGTAEGLLAFSASVE